MKLLSIICINLLLVIFLSNCSNTPTNPDYVQKFETLQNAGIKEAIAIAGDWKYTAPQITSYVNSTELVVQFPDGAEIKKTLPENEFYVAIAPYIEETHECETHYLSSCKGELSKKQFQVTINDSNGKLLLNENYTSLKNGFFELWLQRNETYHITIEYNSLKAEVSIDTFPESFTCITTAKLE